MAMRGKGLRRRKNIAKLSDPTEILVLVRIRTRQVRRIFVVFAQGTPISQSKEVLLSLILRNHKVYKQMSQFIGTRDGIQCRSHHVKQLRTYGQIRKIIERFNCGGRN